jgi:hypothetical protein
MSAPPSQPDTREKPETQSRSHTSPQKSANQQPVAESREDPYETDYTYDAPEEEEILSAPPGPSSTARGKRPEIPEDEVPSPSQITELIHVEFNAASSSVYCGPISQDTMLKKLECSHDIVSRILFAVLPIFIENSFARLTSKPVLTFTAFKN